MTIPEVDLTVVDGGLGIVGDAADNIHIKVGVCSSGTVGTLYSFSDINTIKTTLGNGPLARAAAFALNSPTLAKSGSPVYCVRLTASVAGVFSTVQKTAIGSSTGTVSVAGTSGSSGPHDRYVVIVEITRTGTVGVGAFRYSLDNGTNHSVEINIPGGGTYDIPNTNMTLTFTPGAGAVYFEDGDLFAFRTVAPSFSTSDLSTAMTAIFASPVEWEVLDLVGAVVPALSAVTAAGTTPPTVTVSGTPTDYYDVRVEITTGGARGTAVFKYSLDGGLTYTTGVTTAATNVLTGTGITVAFATGTYATDNVYTFNSGNAAAARTMANALSTHMATALTNKRYVMATMEMPDDTDTNLTSNFSTFQDYRVSVAAGYEYITDAVTSFKDKRSSAWPYAARLAAIKPAVSPNAFDNGGLANVQSLVRDERVTEVLNAQRFVTLRTYLGVSGFYVTEGKTMAAGSDYETVMNVRVVNKACRTARIALLRFLGKTVRVKRTTGQIAEDVARGVELNVRRKIEDALKDQISAVSVTVNRTDNLLSTKILRCKIAITPLGYIRSIEAEVGLELQSS